MRSALRSQSTTAAIASVAFIVACVSHEAVGHAGMCLLVGGRVILLTSVYFRCIHGAPIVDAAGPLMNLVVGVICWWLARRQPPTSLARLFFVLSMAFNLFWGAGYFVYSALANTGDWAFVLRDLALEPRWLWRLGMGLAGVLAYRLAIGMVAALTPGAPLVAAYFAAAVVACVSALFFAGPVLPALGEAASESAGANVGLLLIAAARWRRVRGFSSPSVVPYSAGWLVFSSVVTALFFFLLGRGYTAGGWPRP